MRLAVLALIFAGTAAQAQPPFGQVYGAPNPIIGGVNAQTTNYAALYSDSGKLLTFNCASACTVTLPNPPLSAYWFIVVEDIGAGTLTVNPNSLNLDGSPSTLAITTNQGTEIFTNGTSYYTSRGVGAGSGSGISGGGGSPYLALWSGGLSLATSLLSDNGTTLTYPGLFSIGTPDGVNGACWGLLDATGTHQFKLCSAASGANLTSFLPTSQSANHGLCWKSDGQSIGYCSTVLASDGTCTCN